MLDVRGGLWMQMPSVLGAGEAWLGMMCECPSVNSVQPEDRGSFKREQGMKSGFLSVWAVVAGRLLESG